MKLVLNSGFRDGSGSCRVRRPLALLAVLVLVTAACGDDSGSDTAGGPSSDRPTVVATTSLLGDVVARLVGTEVEVVTIVPAGADPHDFQPSARQVDQIQRADVLVVNGGGFEEGLLDVLERAEAGGVPTFRALDHVDALAASGDHEHDDGDLDPHFFTDPARMHRAARALVDFLVDVLPPGDTASMRDAATGYLDELAALDREVEDVLAAVPEPARVLVTHHDVLAYFADRYDFTVLGTIVGGGSTLAGVGAGDLAALADLVEREGVPAVFVEASSSDALARTLAAEVGGVEVVTLFAESLGAAGSDGDTYLGMIRTNAERIATALG